MPCIAAAESSSQETCRGRQNGDDGEAKQGYVGRRSPVIPDDIPGHWYLWP